MVDMLEELKRVLDKGGGLCMYDIEFEAGVVMEALKSLQLPINYLSRWHDAATLGRPLLNLDLLRWAFDYPLKVELVELHKLCEHILGKTAFRNDPGLRCWMLFRRVHVKVHEHTSKTKKRVPGTGSAVSPPAPDNVAKRPCGFSMDNCPAQALPKKTPKAPKARNIIH